MKKKLTIKQKKYTGESSVVSLRMPNQLIKRIDETAEISGRTREVLRSQRRSNTYMGNAFPGKA